MIVSIISQGMVWAILGLGIFMTFRILNFPDMTTEGSFPLGGAVAVSYTHLDVYKRQALRGGKMLKSKRPIHSDQQIAAIKKLASSAISNPAHWYQVTQFFSLAKTNDLHAETEKILENNGRYYHYPKSLIPLLVEAGMLCIESEDKKRVAYSFPSQEAQVFCRNKGHILEVYLYLLALESQLFDECMIGGEIDWNGIFPEADNVQNEIDVILRK